jgi:Flp pilus assembly protein TadG
MSTTGIVVDTADRRDVRDRGDTMLMTVILVTFLMLGAFALISGSQQWSARRDVQAAAAAAARASVQVSDAEVRGGRVQIDLAAAQFRASQVCIASGYMCVVSVSATTATVTLTGPVDYSFNTPGFPTSLTASATASVQRGVVSGS